MFGMNYLVILKYIEPPKELTIEKFYQCAYFIDKYEIYLNMFVTMNECYNHLCNVMNIFESYFGGIIEYNKVADILKKIHESHITKGYVKLNKEYPIIFQNTMIESIVSFYKLSVIEEFYNTDKYFYRLEYNDYNWSLYKVTYYTSVETLFKTVSIEKIIVYFRSLEKS